MKKIWLLGIWLSLVFILGMLSYPPLSKWLLFKNQTPVSQSVNAHECKMQLANILQQLESRANVQTPIALRFEENTRIRKDLKSGKIILFFEKGYCVLSDSNKQAILAHELGHLWAGNLEKEWHSDKKQTEADAFAILLVGKNDLENVLFLTSYDYLSKNPDVPASLFFSAKEEEKMNRAIARKYSEERINSAQTLLDGITTLDALQKRLRSSRKTGNILP